MKKYLSFDIGGTNLKYAIIDHSGNIIEKNRISTNTKNLNDFMTSLYQIADKYKAVFSGIAICVPGKIDTKHKIIHFGGSLPFLDGLNLEDTLGKRYQVPISVENDGKSAALAEQWLGNLNHVKTGITMTLGTGVGGGIVVNGHILHGKDFQAGELSWLLINSSLASSDLDAFTAHLCSAVLMIEAVNKALHNRDVNDGLAAFAAINNGDKTANRIFSQFCRNIAILILNVQAIINGEKVVIGGGISVQPRLITEIKHQFNELIKTNPMLQNQVISPEIVSAKLGNDANLFGALYALLLNLKNN